MKFHSSFLSTAVLLFSILTAPSSHAQTKLQPIPFDSSSNPSVRKIVLLDTPEISKYRVWDTGGSIFTALFGVVAGMTRVAHIEALAEKLTSEYSRQGINYSKAVDKAIEERLKQAGYVVERLPGIQPSPGPKEAPLNFQDIKFDGDAILSVRLTTTGFATTTNARTELFPFSFVSVRIMGRDGVKPLLLHFASYCSHLVKSDAVSTIPCAPGVVPITNEDELLSSTASASLLAGADLVAEDIVKQLGPAPAER